MKHLLLAALALCFFLDSNAQVSVNGVNVPTTLKTSSSSLTLNGAGVRKKAFFKVYVLGLYLPQKSKNIDEMLNANNEIAVRLEITSGVVNSDNMSEAIIEGFEKSLNGNIAPMKSQIDNFISIFSNEKIKEGDVFILDYAPNVGVKSYKNGKLLATTTGEAFKDALFNIWLGKNPVDANLKTKLLGN
ncbi:MAG: chalcone isomerase family protein [Chitinophagales bacterium]